MALRRMFSKAVVESDKFYELSKDAQTLYFHWAINADDDGFVTCPKRIAAYLNAGNAAGELAKAGYVYVLDSGAVVIRDWHLMNVIRKDRYNETENTDDMDKLDLVNDVYVLKPSVKDKGDNVATIWQPFGNHLATSDGQTGNQLATQYSIVKDSIVKEDSRAERVKPRANVPTPREVYDYYMHKGLTVRPERFYNLNAEKHWTVDGEAMQDWRAAYEAMDKTPLPDEKGYEPINFNPDDYKQE